MGKRLIVVLAVVVLLVGGGGAAYLHFAQGPAAPAEVPGVLVDLGEFTTNLADTDQRRLIQLHISVEAAGPAGEQALKDHQAAVADAVNAALRGFTAAQVSGGQGVSLLHHALMSVVNQVIGDPVVRQVYLTGIVVQ